MNPQKIINAHAKRMGVTREQLTEALLFHAAGELLAWADEEERSDPGSVWCVGDAPDWLEPHLSSKSAF